MATIEKRDKSWRIGVRMPSGGPYSRRWVRRTFCYADNLPEAEVRKRLALEAKRLELDVAEGRASPDFPNGISDAAQEAQPTLIPGELPTIWKPVAPSDLTVRQLYTVWVRDHVNPNCTPVTAHNYTYLFEARILPAIGDLPFNSLTPQRLNAFLRSIAETPKQTTAIAPSERHNRAARKIPLKEKTQPISANTLRHYYDVMSYMCEQGVRWRVLYRNPMHDVERPRLPHRQSTAVSDDDAAHLLALLSEEPIMRQTAILLAVLCGLRLGEVCALRWSDLDTERSTISVSKALKVTPETGPYIAQPKTPTSVRTVTLPPGMMDLLAAVRAYHDHAQATLGDAWRGDGRIITGWDGKPVSHDTPSRWWRRFADAHGYSHVRFHDLRHTHASILLANHIDVATVAARLGHSTPDTTLRIYADAVRARDTQSADIMQSYLTPRHEDKP